MKTKHEASTKPYFRCLSCPRFRNLCGGIPTRNMDLENWCEYMRDVRDKFTLHNADIARDADVSTKTIERIMSINYEQDIMRATARRIELAVIGTANIHTCHLDHNDSDITNKLIAEVEHLRKENERYAKIIDKYLE